MGQFRSKLLNCLKRGFFFGKLTNITFVYLLHPHHPTSQTNLSSWSLDIKLHNVGPNWAQIANLPQKRFLGKTDCYYCILPTVFFHATKFQKWSSENKSWDTRLHNFGPNWAWIVLSPKWVFFGKVDQHCFGLTIASHHATSFQKSS